MNANGKALLIGFEPFNGETVNPSQQIVAAIDGEHIAGHAVVGAILPTEFARSIQGLRVLLERHRPGLVLALGQAGGRDGISIERIAINVVDARVPDNAGDQPVDVAVLDDAPSAYLSTLPIKAMLKKLQTHGIPASISNTAGTFVCNQVFFALAHLAATQYPEMRSGFVHVPFLPEQTRAKRGLPSMPLPAMVTAARMCLEIALTTRHDLNLAAGTTH